MNTNNSLKPIKDQHFLLFENKSDKLEKKWFYNFSEKYMNFIKVHKTELESTALARLARFFHPNNLRWSESQSTRDFHRGIA